MRRIGNFFSIAVLTATLVLAGYGVGQAKRFYKFGSFPPGTTPFIVNTSWANAVNKYVPGAEIQISATGPATQHGLMVTEGKMDFTMGAQSMYYLMFKQIGPFKRIKDGPERVKKISAIFSYPIGVYHFVVYANSGIKTLQDIKGKKVFLGPPGGVATRNTKMLIDAMTGYQPGKDFEQVKMGWGAAAAAFQDKKFEVWIPTTSPPSPQITQIAMTNKILLLGLDESKFNHPSWKKYMKQPSRRLEWIPADTYGKNQVNTKPVLSTGAWVGLSCRTDLPTDLIYKMTKAYWEHIDEAHAMAAWMPRYVNKKDALAAIAGQRHPGAEKYYREIGMKIPKPFTLEKK